MSDWTYVPDRSYSASRAPRVREVKFGDGYSQRLQDGINYINESYSLSFNNRSFTDISAMDSFLETRGGSTSFTWTPPGEVEIKVICRNWDISVLNHTGVNSTSIGSLTATFERVYE
jgi:phage-related protein